MMMININLDDYFTRLNHLINKIELALKKCSKKYQDKREIDLLHSDLSSFLMQENLNDCKLNDELTLIEKELRKTNNYNEVSRRKLNESKEKIRFLNTEIKSIKTLLEKSSNNWIKFKDSFDSLQKWLNDQEKIADLPKTDLTSYQRFQKLHAQFNESANFILLTCDAATSAKVKDKILYLNKAWKMYQDRFKDTQYDQLVKYYECELSLNMISDRLIKIEQLTRKQCKCNLNSVSKYQEELQKAYNDVECLDANLKLLEKLLTRLDLSDDPSLNINQLVDGIRNAETKLNYFRQIMPDFLKNLTKTCTQIASIEEGLHQIEYWIIEGENYLKSEPDQLNFEQIIRHIEHQKSLKTLATFNFDYSDLTLKLTRVKDLLQNLNMKRLKWEEQFNAHHMSWKYFHQKTKLLEEWISNAQSIVTERNEDYSFLIHKHKAFFDTIADDILQNFLTSGDKLLQVKNDVDKVEIKLLMDTLEGQWKMIVSHAPVRLLKLQFKQLETLLRQEIKAADIEITEECQALNDNSEDITEILKRHEAKFKHSNFFTTCENYLQGLRMCSKELGEKRVEEKSSIEDILDSLQTYWLSLTKKIETINAKLTVMPGARENFERNFFQFASWLNELEQNSNALTNNNLTSSSEYRRLLDKTKASLSEFNVKKDQYYTILSQYDYLSAQNCILPTDVQIEIDILKSRFTQLCHSLEQIEKRNSYLETVVNLASKSDILANKIRNLSAASARRFMAEEDDRSLQSAINDQKSVIDEIKLFETEIEDIKNGALSCSDGDLSRLPSLFHEKITNTQEAVKQCLAEELERRSSLLEIKKSTELKQNKLDALYRHLEFIQKLFEQKYPVKNDEQDISQSSPQSGSHNSSLDNYDTTDYITGNNSEYSGFLNGLDRCKKLIQISKQLTNELKTPIASDSSPIFFQLGSANRSSPTPSYHEYHELREIELKLDSYAHQIESQIDVFEANLLKHAKLKKKFDKIDMTLNDLIEKFHLYDLSLLNNSNSTGQNEQILELEHDQLRIDLDQINQLKKELNVFLMDKAELIKTNSINLNKSKSGTLNEGFNEAIYECDLRNDHELNEVIEIKSVQLQQIEQKCVNSLNEFKSRIDEMNRSKKQMKLDSFKTTLDFELPECNYAEESDDETSHENERYCLTGQAQFKMTQKEAEDNLLRESADILLNDLTNNENDEEREADKIEIELELDNNNEKSSKQNAINIFFNKTTELDIQKDYNDDNEPLPIENRSVNVKITTHIDEEEEKLKSIDDEEFDIQVTHETSNGSATSKTKNSDTNIDENTNQQNDAQDESIESNSVSINYEMTPDEEAQPNSPSVQIRIHVEPKRDDNDSPLEMERFERIVPIQSSTEAERISSEQRLPGKYERRRTEEETTYGFRIQSDELCSPTEDEANQQCHSNTNDTILIDSIEEIVEGNQDEDGEMIGKENSSKMDEHLVNLLSRSSEFKNISKDESALTYPPPPPQTLCLYYNSNSGSCSHISSTSSSSSSNDLIIENEMKQIDELNRMNTLKVNQINIEDLLQKNEALLSQHRMADKNFESNHDIYKAESIAKSQPKIEMQLIEKETVTRSDYVVERDIERVEIETIIPTLNNSSQLNSKVFVEEQTTVHLHKIDDCCRMREKLNQLKIEDNESAEQIRLKQMELKKFELEKLKHENNLRRKELQDMEVERARNQERNILIEKKLKETFDRFSQLKEKITKVSELTLEECTDENELTTLFTNYEYELNSLNSEITNLGLEIDSFGESKIDPANCTQFDLIKSFASYLNSQLDQKKASLKLLMQQKIKLTEWDKSLQTNLDIAFKFINEKQCFVQNILDLEARIESVRSLDESIQNCLKQINQLSLEYSSANSACCNQLEIETNVLRPLGVYAVDLRKFLAEWKYFESDFNKLTKFLKYDFRIDSLIYEKENKDTQINYATLEVDFKKYSMLNDKLSVRIAETADLMLCGTALFNCNNIEAIDSSVCNQSRGFFVSVPDAVKEFNDVKTSIHQVARYLDEQCSRLHYAIKQKEKLKELENNLNKLKHDLDQMHCLPTSVLAEKKMRMQRLSDIRREFKCLVEDKASLTEAIQLPVYKELEHSLDTVCAYIHEKSCVLEHEIQEEIMKCLPSRVALNDLLEWLHAKIELVEKFSKKIGTEDCKSIAQLEIYKNNLQTISQEIADSKETCLQFVRDAIEDEMKQGFYDFNMSEHLARTEREWFQLKQKISNDLERLNLSLVRINEFDKNVAQMQEWIQSQTIAEMNHLATDSSTVSPTKAKLSSLSQSNMNIKNTIEDDKKILTQINDYKELLLRLESIWQQERVELIQNQKCQISLIVQEHMSKNLDELKSNLQRMELISKLKIESNLSDAKRAYANETVELNATLESEINFIQTGRIVSYKQIESASHKISDCIFKLNEKRNKIKQILSKFETELNGTCYGIDGFDSIHLNDMKHAASFQTSHMEEKAHDLLQLLEKEILPVWLKYEETYQILLAKLTDANQNTRHDLENIEKIIISCSAQQQQQTPQLFQSRLKEMTECKKYNTQFEHYSSCLIEKLCQNESTMHWLKQNKLNLQDMYDQLSELADAFKKRFDTAYTEHQIYTNLITELTDQSQQGNRLLQNFTSVQTITMRGASFSESNLNLLRTFANDFEKCEQCITASLNKLKLVNIRDSERLEKMRIVSMPCASLMEQMRHCRLTALEYIQERNHFMESRVNEIEKYLELFQEKRNEEMKIDPDQELVVSIVGNGRQTLTAKALVRLINGIKFMINKNVELNKYGQFLDDNSLSSSSSASGSTVEHNLNEDNFGMRIKLAKETVKKMRKQIELATSSNGIYELLIRLSSLNEQLNKEINAPAHSNQLDQLKKCLEKFLSIRIDLEKQLIHLQEMCLNFIDFRSLKTNLLDPIENFYNRQVNEIDSMNKTHKRYKTLLAQVNSSLNEIDEKLTTNQASNQLNKIIEKNELEKASEFENTEAKLNYFKTMKTFLSGAQLKTDIEIVQQLGEQLQKRGYISDSTLKSSSSSSISKSQLNHETLRVKYLEITNRVNVELEGLEVEFQNWKSLVNKSKILLDLIKYTHEQLSKTTMSSFDKSFHKANSGDESIFFDQMNNTTLNGLEDTNDLLNEVLLANSNLNCKLELANSKSLTQMIEMLKLDIQAKLNENEPIKQEITDLSKLAALIKSYDLEFVKNILTEWNVINEKVHAKLVKLEKVRKYLAELDSKLNKVRELLVDWESQIDKESFASYDITDFQLILNKKADLECMFDMWGKKDPEIQAIFKTCLNANKNILNSNKQNQVVIMSIKHRWQNIRLLVKEKIFLVQNIWLLYCDLNDQIENFYLVIEKTDQFYKNTLQSANNNPKMFLKLIQELYFTIQNDFKLVKYLNESYVNFASLASYFSLFQLLDMFKEKFHRINSEWDTLHNEIAIRIKMTRKHETKSSSSKERLNSWINEINLLITNLEYLSAKELKIKQSEVLELKKEVCDQTETMFKSDNLLKDEPCLVEKMKDMMKRIIKLDSYLQQSSSQSPSQISPLFNIESSPSSSELIGDFKYFHSSKIPSAISLNTVQQSTKFLLKKNQSFLD